jgi:phage portal protein BeeE
VSLLSRVLPDRRPARSAFPGLLPGGPLSGRPAQIETWGRSPVEQIGRTFESYAELALGANSAVAAVEHIRLTVFSQARLCWQEMEAGRPGKPFGDRRLSVLERPWRGGTTADLLARMLLHVDLAGNAFVWRDPSDPDRLRLLRPDWTDILLAPGPYGIGWDVQGYRYRPDGSADGAKHVELPPAEVAHFAPYPDPLATYRGMSWMTPVVRDVMADQAAGTHRIKFFENAATPNMAISLPKEIDPEEFHDLVDLMEKGHTGADNAYKTMYLAGGADLTVIGKDMREMDFSATQGAGETRIAAASGVGAVLAKLSEGLKGSSLNAGNFQAARRLFTDTTANHLWANAAGTLEQLILPDPTASPGLRLWYDGRDIPFLREDAQDQANIASRQAMTIRTLVDAGYLPETVVHAVENQDWSGLRHSGLFSVQLQKPLPGAPSDV